MTALIDTIEHGAITELRLARAPVNALNPELCAALEAAIGTAVEGGALGLVLSGGEKVFSAGLDVPHLLTLQSRRELGAAWTSFLDAARALATCPVPVAAAITGHSPAGGCVLALCCDYRVMAEGAFRIGLNETRVGLVAPDGMQQLMRRVVGPRCAERLLVEGELVESARALQIGLVRTRGTGEVTARAVAWLQALLALPRAPVLHTRAIARADLHAALAPERIDIDTSSMPGTRLTPSGPPRAGGAAGQVARRAAPRPPRRPEAPPRACPGARGDGAGRILDPAVPSPCTAPRRRDPRAPSPAGGGRRSRPNRTSPPRQPVRARQAAA